MAATGFITPEQSLRTGLNATFNTASIDGHYIKNDGRVFLHVKNTGSQVNMTVVTPRVTGTGNAIADKVSVITATTGDQVFGPWPPSEYNDSAGNMLVQFSGVTGVTFAAIHV